MTRTSALCVRPAIKLAVQLVLGCLPVALPTAVVLGQSAGLRDSISLSEVGLDQASQLALISEHLALVTGPRQTVLLVDLRNGDARFIAREGEGPGEVREASRIFGCGTGGGWVDSQLRRITWVSSGGRVQESSTMFPPSVSSGQIVGASCDGDVLWISIEARSGSGAETVDTMRVYRVPRGSSEFALVDQRPSTRRLQSQRGTLIASLRVPGTGSHHLVARRDGSADVLTARGDSVVHLPAVPGTRRGRGVTWSQRRLSRSEVASIRDSVLGAAEDEMSALRYSDDLQREFRTLLAEVARRMEIPPVVARGRAIMLVPNRPTVSVMLERDEPRSPRSCVAIVRDLAEIVDRRCFTWGAARIEAIAVGDGALWWLLSDEESVWLQRSPSFW